MTFKRMTVSLATTVMAILFLTAPVSAAPIFTSIDLSGVANERLQIRNANYPTGQGVLLGGVPFDIPVGRNTWQAANAAGGGPGVVSLTLPIGLDGVTGVHTLINTLWGTPVLPALATLRFTFDDGTVFLKQLVGGVDVRDYYQNTFTNTINNTTTVRVFFTDSDGIAGPNRYRLDKQFIDLSAFSDKTLVSLTLVDRGNQNVQRIFLAGLTVEQAVPEPSTLILIVVGAVGGLVRRWRRVVADANPASA
jgi:PEP-CTERM motif